MLSDNIKHLRTQKGLSQAELAEKLHVVRQTISKWETGLSVPDATLLTRLAEALDTTVSTLLGEPPVSDAASPTITELAEKLEALNGEFARRAELRRKGWRIAFLIILIFALLSLGFTLWLSLPPSLLWGSVAQDVGIIGGADGPTAILVSDAVFKEELAKVFLVILILASIIGLVKTRRR